MVDAVFENQKEFFFFNDTATTEIYTLSLHDALPIYLRVVISPSSGEEPRPSAAGPASRIRWPRRSEEHTSELQSRLHLVCRLLLEKKKKRKDDTGFYSRQELPKQQLDTQMMIAEIQR